VATTLIQKEYLSDRKLLHDRHRLSHEQIDRLLGERSAKEFLQEKMMRMVSVKHFIDITDRLREAGIKFLCLKGPLLSYRIYGDASVRFSHDIDLLIDFGSLNEIIRLMLGAQYELADGLVWPVEKFKQDLLRQHLHHLSFFNTKLKVCVEFHWVLTINLPIHQNVVSKILADNLTNVDYAGRSFTVMNKEFELVYLLIHGSSHGWNRLKWLVDINDYPINELNLDKWKTLITRFHMERILGQTNYLLQEIFHMELPVKGGKRIPATLIRYAEAAIKAPLANDESTRMIIRYYRYQFLLFPQLLYRWGVVKRFFSRPGDVMSIGFSSKTAYYLYRPFSFIQRRIFRV